MVGNSFLQNNQLRQPISWSRPPHHTSKLHYIVKYGPSSVVDRPTHPSVSTTTSSNTTVILTLPIPTTPVVYNVWVAAVSDVGKGEYSRRKQVHYTSKTTQNTYEQHVYTVQRQHLYTSVWVIFDRWIG